MINLSASRKKYDPCAKIESPFAALRAQLLGGAFPIVPASLRDLVTMG